MGVPDYSIVVGVDARHLEQLTLTWRTWKRNKPSLLQRPLVVFYDCAQLRQQDVESRIPHPDLTMVAWPFQGMTVDDYVDAGAAQSKWNNPQRAMMLSGFVFVPYAWVTTPYWLKIDTDVVVQGPDDWIDPAWFDGDPVIISHPWTFSKPGDVMVRLDEWADSTVTSFAEPPLNLRPNPGSDRVGHKRIISFCGLFSTRFTECCADLALMECRQRYHLPVPSQDSYMWYIAKRCGSKIVAVNMKSRGWHQWSTDGNVRKYTEEALQ